MNMSIFIPSYDRANNQITIKQIPKKYLSQTFIVVRGDQLKKYKKYNKGFQILPCPIIGIVKTKQWILEECKSKYVLIIDDDMTFNIRKNGKLTHCNEKEMIRMIELLESWLDEGIVHVGISQRFGNNRVSDTYAEITRMDNVYAFNCKVLSELKKSHNVGFHWLEEKYPKAKIMENFAIMLKLFSLGYKNRVSYDFCWSQKKSGMEGGCSSYRTYDVQKYTTFIIAKEFPNIAIPVKKVSKIKWEGIGYKRWDLKIMWKKSFKKMDSVGKKKIEEFFL